MVTVVFRASIRSLPPGEGARTGARFSTLGFISTSIPEHTALHMTGPFLPRPSPDAFECDSNGHLRGQHVRLRSMRIRKAMAGKAVPIYPGRAQGGRVKTQELLYQINARQTQDQSPLHFLSFPSSPTFTTATSTQKISSSWSPFQQQRCSSPFASSFFPSRLHRLKLCR